MDQNERNQSGKFFNDEELFDIIGLLIQSFLEQTGEWTEIDPETEVKKASELEIDPVQNTLDALALMFVKMKNNKALIARCRDYLWDFYGIDLGEETFETGLKAVKGNPNIK